MTDTHLDPVQRELAGASLGRTPGPHWLRWIAGRIGVGVVVVLVVSVLVFAATQALPADPAQAILGRNATPARLAALREQLGLNRSVVDQYFSWLLGLSRGDFGMSLAARRPVSDLIGGRLNNSLILMASSALVALPLSVLLGIVTSVRRDSAFDRGLLWVGMVLNSLPDFVIGMLLVVMFATTVLPVLPAVAIFPDGSSPLAQPEVLVLPIATLVLAVLPYLYRLVRASMVDALESDYIQMSRLKGLPPRLVTRRHALPNAMIPGIQGSALVLTALLSGTVVVEYVFRYPGLGTALADAVANRDLPVIQVIVLIYAIGTVLFNIGADILTVLFSPRLRTANR
ncbi:MAG: ABC transporter permease [Mycobacterium sp.]